MKAVVFGGSGFLGTWLVKKLVENNIKTTEISIIQ